MILSTAFLQIMAFYFALAFIIFPVIAFFTFGKNSRSIGDGWVAGSIISIILWFAVGRNMI